MKITKSQLKQIINEELNTLLSEQEYRVQQPGSSPYDAGLPEPDRDRSGYAVGWGTSEDAGLPAESRAEWRGLGRPTDPRYQVGLGGYRHGSSFNFPNAGASSISYPPSEYTRGQRWTNDAPDDFVTLATDPTPESIAAIHQGPKATSPLVTPYTNPRPLSPQEAQERLEQLALLSNEPATFADTFGVQSLLPRYVERFDTGDPINPYQDDAAALTALGFGSTRGPAPEYGIVGDPRVEE